MGHKGPNRRGSIFESPKGSGIWWCQLPPDDLNKRPKRRAKSEQEAIQKLIGLEKERAAGIHVSDNPTIAELIRSWLTTVVQPNVTARSFEVTPDGAITYDAAANTPLYRSFRLASMYSPE